MVTRKCYQLSILEQKGGKSSDSPPLERSHFCVATTVRHPGQGGREGSISCGCPRDNSAGRARDVHICQRSAIQRRKRAATTRIVGKHRRVLLESLRYDQNRPNIGLSQIECYLLGKTCETESKAFPSGSPLDYLNRGSQSSESRFH